jgi:hypothetical protein
MTMSIYIRQKKKWQCFETGRQAYIQGSTLAIWEVMLLVQSYKGDVSAVARHLKWPEAKAQTATDYAKAFPEEIEGALSDNAATDLETLKRMLPQAAKFVSRPASKTRCSSSFWMSISLPRSQTVLADAIAHWLSFALWHGKEGNLWDSQTQYVCNRPLGRD